MRSLQKIYLNEGLLKPGDLLLCIVELCVFICVCICTLFKLLSICDYKMILVIHVYFLVYTFKIL